MKSGAGLASYARAQLGRPYWWGTFGQTATPELLAQKQKQYPEQYGNFDFSPHMGQKVHDCCGLIKGYRWCEGPDSPPRYEPSQDLGVAGLYNDCSERGGMSSMPDEPGVLVFRQGLGHVGVYLGSGKVAEAMGKRWGVVETDLSRRSWAFWGKPNWLSYGNAPGGGRKRPTYYYNLRLGLLKPGMEDYQVKVLQRLLRIEESGIMDEKTVEAVKRFQKKAAILCDGEVGGETWTSLLRGSGNV